MVGLVNGFFVRPGALCLLAAGQRKRKGTELVSIHLLTEQKQKDGGGDHCETAG